MGFKTRLVMDNIEEDYWVYEDPEIYDGWILQFHSITREVIWRNHHAVDKLTPEKKLEIEQHIKDMKFYD